MTLQEVKQTVLDQCAKEKKIVIRNLLIIAGIVLVLLILIGLYALPLLTKFIQETNPENAANSNSGGYLWLLPIGLLLSLFYPVKKIVEVFRREKQAHRFFDQIQQGSACSIHAETKVYLTIIPLYWIKLKLDPMHYLQLSIQQHPYLLPVTELLIPDIKRRLSQANLQNYEAVMTQLYSNESPEDLHSTETTPTETAPLPSLQAFQEYALEKFGKLIDGMEKNRSSVRKMFFLMLLLSVGFILGMTWFFNGNPTTVSGPGGTIKVVIAFIVFSFVLCYGYLFFYKRKTAGNTAEGNFTEFKSSIFKGLIHFINPRFDYIEKAHIGLPEWLHSGLFVDRAYRITGSDQIIGQHQGVPFQSCNLTVTYRPNFSKEKEPDDQVFSGNYFVARFHKAFASPIYIHPKKGVFGQWRDNAISAYLNTPGHKIQLEDPIFREQFQVYCEDEVLARYVLTPAMMERFKTINQRNKGHLYIAINRHNMVMATNTGNATEAGNSLNGLLFTKIDQELLNNIYEELTEQLRMIDVLKLPSTLQKN